MYYMICCSANTISFLSSLYFFRIFLFKLIFHHHFLIINNSRREDLQKILKISYLGNIFPTHVKIGVSIFSNKVIWSRHSVLVQQLAAIPRYLECLTSASFIEALYMAIVSFRQCKVSKTVTHHGTIFNSFFMVA